MSRVLSLLARLFVFSVIVAAVISAFAWALVGGFHEIAWRAWFVGPAVVGTAWLWTAISAEAGLTRTLGYVEVAPPALKHTIARAFERLGGKPPRVMIFASPLPSFAVARSFVGEGPGVVFLSRGLLAQLSERELRAALRWCALRSRQPGLALESLCAYAAIRLFALAPAGWRDVGSKPGVRGLEPWSCLAYLFVHPLARFLAEAGRHWPDEIDLALVEDPTGLMGEWQEHWFSAVREVRRALATWRVRAL